jgi:murein DD-endopeptidase MepM/ murein hydrolase activator NlpD
MPRKRPAKQAPRSRNRARGALVLGAALITGVYVNLRVFVWDEDTSIEKMRELALTGPAAAPAGDGDGDGDGLPEADEPADDLGSWTAGEVERGDTLGRILRHRGVPTADADAILRALEPHADLRLIRPGQRYRLHARDDGAYDGFELELSASRKVRVSRGASGFTAQAQSARTEVRLEEVGGTITSSLYGAVHAAGEDPRLLAVLVDLFAYDLDFYNDQHQGDTFRLLVEKEYLDGKLLRYLRVRAAEYRGKAGTFRALWYQSHDGRVQGYFRDNGDGVEKTFLETPLKFPPSKRYTPVWAVAPGRIVARGPQGAAGNQVAIEHGNGYTTLYTQLAQFRAGQKIGQRVRPKTVIGYIVAGGRSSSMRQHFAMRKNGAAIDPLTVKKTPGPGVPKGYRLAFDAEVSRLTARLARISVQPRAPEPADADAAPEEDEAALPDGSE